MDRISLKDKVEASEIAPKASSRSSDDHANALESSTVPSSFVVPTPLPADSSSSHVVLKRKNLALVNPFSSKKPKGGSGLSQYFVLSFY